MCTVCSVESTRMTLQCEFLVVMYILRWPWLLALLINLAFLDWWEISELNESKMFSVVFGESISLCVVSTREIAAIIWSSHRNSRGC